MEVLRDRKGVNFWSAGITLNGTIYVKMNEVTPRNMKILSHTSRSLCVLEYSLFAKMAPIRIHENNKI